MPVCYITVSEKIKELSDADFEFIKDTVASGLDSSARKLDGTHIALRLNHGTRSNMLGDIELDIYAQLYLPRLFSRDKRANQISRIMSSRFDCCCATWINLGYVGYSRVDKDYEYFSDSDSVIVRILQRVKGVSTRKRKDTID